MESRKIIVEPTPDDASARVAELVRLIISQSVEEKGVCFLSLAGGTTPHHTYRKLARGSVTDNVPWRQVEFFFGDERDVPHDNVESNFRMVQRNLLDEAPIDWTRVHPMLADADDLEAASMEYEQAIRDRVPAGPDGLPQFDLVMLGMGGDGHTASLFPGCPSLEEKHKLVTHCHVPVLGRNRMTVTFPLINAAKNILLLVTGDDKADIVKRVFKQGETHLPVARIHPRHGVLHVVLDRSAARLL
jgi:6-phosphogluconolactonase